MYKLTVVVQSETHFSSHFSRPMCVRPLRSHVRSAPNYAYTELATDLHPTHTHTHALARARTLASNAETQYAFLVLSTAAAVHAMQVRTHTRTKVQ